MGTLRNILILFIGINGLSSFTFEGCSHLHGKHPDKIDKEKFVARHNYYRNKVGAPNVEWSDEIAAYAQLWADRLAKGCNMKHRNSSKYGENIYMTSGKADENRVVDKWAEEEKYFNHKKRTYERGTGRKYGHYSQVIWRDTKLIGAGVATCRNGSQIWVCNYDPPGNYIGEKVY